MADAAGREAKRRIAAFLHERRADEVRFLAELVKQPSDNPPGDCAPHGRVAAGLLRELGLAVEEHVVPPELCRAHGMKSAVNLVVRRRFGAGPTVALNAHGDVVPPGEGWSVEPYGAVVRDGVMYGRGVAVSKSDFATYAFALLALEALALPLAGAVELHFTYDEEAGGEIGPKWLLDAGIVRPDYAIGAGFSYSLVTAHNGCLHLEVEVSGTSAHAARPDSGADALAAATRVLAALYAAREGYRARHSAVDGIGSPTLVVGLIAGGINTNVVPDRVTFRLDRRVIPEEDMAAAEAELRQVIAAAVEGLPGIAVAVRRILAAAPLQPLPGVERIAAPLAANAARIFGQAMRCHGIPLYTDGRHYAAAGVPVVLYGAGPRDLLEANAHRADERLVLADLYRATEVVAAGLLDFFAGPLRE
ncbi:MAG: M20/M25/M40 family metallo-hydrolase [Alphaproteobacteria bacterium]